MSATVLAMPAPARRQWSWKIRQEIESLERVLAQRKLSIEDRVELELELAANRKLLAELKKNPSGRLSVRVTRRLV